jgi:hypothetical protein
VKEIFQRIDEQGYGYVSFEEFSTGLRRFFKKLTENECDILAKRYVVNNKNHVIYTKLFEELDLIDRHINPLMVWAIDMADSINKIIYIKGFSSFNTFISKYSRDGKRVTLTEFLKSSMTLGITELFKEGDIKRFFQYCS